MHQAVSARRHRRSNLKTISKLSLCFWALCVALPVYAQSALEVAFNQLPYEDRRHIQENLSVYGQMYPQAIGYSGAIDGMWGLGTRTGIVDAVNRLNAYYSRGYNLDDVYHAMAALAEISRGNTTIGEGNETGSD